MMQKKYYKIIAAVGFTGIMSCVGNVITAQQKVGDYPIQPVAFTKVHLTDDFWAPRLETNAKVIIPYILEQCKEHGRIDNFLIAAHKKKGKLSTYPLMMRTYIN